MDLVVREILEKNTPKNCLHSLIESNFQPNREQIVTLKIANTNRLHTIFWPSERSFVNVK